MTGYPAGDKEVAALGDPPFGGAGRLESPLVTRAELEAMVKRGVAQLERWRQCIRSPASPELLAREVLFAAFHAEHSVLARRGLTESANTQEDALPPPKNTRWRDFPYG